MKLTLRDKKIINVALYLAIEWEESVIDAHTTCADNDDSAVETRIHCKRNIESFKKMKKRFLRAIKYHESIS